MLPINQASWGQLVRIFFTRQLYIDSTTYPCDVLYVVYTSTNLGVELVVPASQRLTTRLAISRPYVSRCASEFAIAIFPCIAFGRPALR